MKYLMRLICLTNVAFSFVRYRPYMFDYAKTGMELKSGTHINNKLLISTRHTRVCHSAESASSGAKNSRVSQRDADAAPNRPGTSSANKEVGDKPGLQMRSAHIQR